MLSSEVVYSTIKKEKRLDSEYYKPEFWEIENFILKSKSSVIKLKKLVNRRASAFYPPLLDYYENKKTVENIPFIRVSDIKYFTVSRANLLYLPKKITKQFRSIVKVKPKTILITKGGTLGNVGIIPEGLGECALSRDLIAIEVKEGTNPYFILGYLTCKYGRLQLERGKSQQVQAHLTLEKISNIVIPKIREEYQKKIEKLVKEAFSKRSFADQKYEQARQLLEKELGLDKLKLKEEKTFETKFSGLNQDLRFNSEYYKPKYKQIIEFLKHSGVEVKKLKEAVNISDKKIDPTKEPTKKFRYVPIAKINSNGEIGEWDEFSGWQAPSRARMLIKGGNVLVSSLGGSLDKIALVPEELNNSLATTGTFVINSEKYYSEFLFLLFRTELIRLQLEQKTAGAIMTAVPKTTFGDLLIPLIPKSNQEQISTLVRESFSLRKKSKNLLEESKKVVERAIETGT